MGALVRREFLKTTPTFGQNLVYSALNQGRIERRGHATHRNIEIFIVTNIRFYAHADVTSSKVH